MHCPPSVLAGSPSRWRPQCGLCELLSSGRPVPPPARPQTMAGLSPGLPFIPPIGPLSHPAPTLGQSGRPKARRGIVQDYWPGPRLGPCRDPEPGQGPIVRLVHCADPQPLTVFSLGKAARGSVVGWSPAWTGPLSVVVVHNCSLFWRDNCHATAEKE